MTEERIYELDADTALMAAGPGRYEGVLVDRWNVGAGMNGGYLAAFCLQGVLKASSLPDPLSMTLHYLARPVPGPAAVAVTTMREGRGHATYRFDLLQVDGGGAAGDGTAGEGAAGEGGTGVGAAGREVGRAPEGTGGDGGAGSSEQVLATGLVLTGRHRPAGDLDFSPPPPATVPPERASELKRWAPDDEDKALWGRLEQRVVSADDVFFMRTTPGRAETGGWTRLADGRPADVLCVPLFLDCWPPAVFSHTLRPGAQGAPTLELTVHWRNPVEPDWLYVHFETELYAGGYVDEKGKLWSRNGVLVAESRQLARYQPLPHSVMDGQGLP